METFVPLYISNKCDSYCSMCNLQHSNSEIDRIEASLDKINEQLHIIYEYEKIRAVCILTGELFSHEARLRNLSLVCDTIQLAFEIGFERVFFNIGSLQNHEIKFIQARIPQRRDVVLSLFQETYEETYYKKHFGSHPDQNAKADFISRRSTIDRWLDYGFVNVDLGILLGFKPVGEDVHLLIEHAQQCIRRGAEVYISTPRIKGGSVDDEEYCSILQEIRQKIPDAKIILTTREKIELMNKMIDIIAVVSPGSSDVCPYNWGQYIANDPRTSQFVIDEKRMRPYDVLMNLSCSKPVKYFAG